MLGGLRGFGLMLAIAAASAALFWLLTEHWGHVLGLAPYLLFLACPLMHLFMHHGHHHKGHDHVRMQEPQAKTNGR